MHKRIFTIEEANRRLPLIKGIVEDILAKGRKVKALSLLNQTPSVKEEYDTLIKEVEVLMAELEALGCYFKDWNFEVGLVDFPAIIEEKEVLLCWRSDESAIEWYHSLEDGYSGRKLIPVYLKQNPQ